MDTLLARTWNDGLWERLWLKDAEGYCSKLCASGVFVPPQRYPDEQTFWAAFEAHASKYHGERYGLPWTSPAARWIEGVLRDDPPVIDNAGR